MRRWAGCSTASGDLRAGDADRRRSRSRRGVRRARRGEPQHLHLRHDAAGAADRRPARGLAPGDARRMAVSLVDVAPTVAFLARPRTVRLGWRRAADRARGRSARQRPVRERRPWRQQSRALRGVVRAAAGLRLEPAADDQERRLEVHRRADAGALRPESRSRRDAQSRRGASRRGSPSSRGKSTRSRPSVLRRDRARRRIAKRAARLQALGYVSGSGPDAASVPDPKDRREIAARFAQVASGELAGRGARARARARFCAPIPRNPQANLRLGYRAARTRAAARMRSAASAPRSPRTCRAPTRTWGAPRARPRRSSAAAAERTLADAAAVEPDNPVVSANLGLLLSDNGQPAAAIPHLQRALSLDPDLHQARFGLAIALRADGPAGRRGAGGRKNCCAGCLPMRRSDPKCSACSPLCARSPTRTIQNP